jgi:hypothetical protein
LDHIESTSGSVEVVQACIANKSGTGRLRTEGPRWGRSITSKDGIKCLPHGIMKIP